MTLNCCIQQIYWGSWKVLKHLRTDVSVNQDTFVKLTWESQLCWQKFKSRSVAVHWRKRKMWTCGLPSTRQYMFQDSPQKFNLGMCWKSFNVNTLLVINALLFHSCRISLFFFLWVNYCSNSENANIFQNKILYKMRKKKQTFRENY